MSDSKIAADSPAVESVASSIESSNDLSDKKKKALAKKAAAAERKAAARAVKSGDTSAPAPASSDSNKSSHDHGNKAEKKPKAEKKAEHAKAIRARSKELPEFVKHRATVWETVMKRIEEEKKNKITENKKIQIKLPDGAVKEGVAGVTSPYDIAMGISKKLAERSIIARVNGDKLVDLMAPLHSDCQIELLDFESKEGKHTYWHSSAHILGEAIELEYQNAQLCIGPPLDEGGFYYDVHLGDTKVTPEDFKSIEELVEQVRKEKQPFIRAELTKAEALEMFKFNQFKTEIIKTKVPDGAICTAYRCGPLIDLCRGPHIPNTGAIGAMKVTKASSSYWLAKADQPSLQRVYGISFPTEKALAEWEKRMKLAEERDHRKVGLHQQLFFFDDISPGSCFFLPHGARIYNTLCNFIRKEYWKRNYTEVISPNMYNIDLWRTSGHYENYKENMFLFEVEKQEFGLKPMNCPGHCMMFKAMLHSYRDLPLRYADFGVLHRNELSGALTGLTRVRRFQQDDAHIFCRRDQIEQEVSSVLDMLKHCYGIFGFQYSLALSTRPEKHLGEPALWDQAEKQLETVLNKFCDANEMKWALNPGDGAFYGPKIDIRLTDALGRHHQCATIQLDFQLPIRFDLGYKTNEDKLERPVMIHRAILGSVERMIAVLTEHTGGKWPFWLSPRQAMIVPVSPSLNDYAELVRKAVHEAGFYVDLDDSTKQFPRKIREAQLQQYNLILVVGEQEKNENSVTVRYRIDNVEAEEVNNKKSKKDGKEQKEADGKDEEKKKFEAQQTKFTIPDLLKHMNELLNSHK